MMKKNEQVKEIVERLEQGVKDIFNSESYKEYLSFMGKFYSYSFNNSLLIWIQKPEATLVAGYKAWQEKFKRQVVKGAKAIKILAPIPHKYKVQIEEDGEIKEEEKAYLTFRVVNVFDISDTDGDEIPTFTVDELTGDVDGYEEIMKKIADASPAPIEFDDITSGAKGYYSIAGKKVVINKGMSQAQTIKTAIHEVSHAILHSDDGEENKADKYTREVQAESVAYTVCSYMGIDTSDYSFGYVTSWSTGKELQELQKSMEVIRKTAQMLIEKLA